MEKEEKNEKIELREEAGRRQIGDIPASLTRLSVAIIIIVAAALVCALAFLPYPYSHGESILRHLLGE